MRLPPEIDSDFLNWQRHLQSLQYDIGNDDEFDFDQIIPESESSEKKRRKMEKKLKKKRYKKVLSLPRLVALAALTQPLLTNKATCQFVLFMLKISPGRNFSAAVRKSCYGKRPQLFLVTIQ